MPENGDNERILIEDCEYGFCHSCLTCGSESIHNRNIILRNIKVHSADRLLWLKMRPDTSQRYEYITIENANGMVEEFMNINPWTQFFDLKGKKDILLSYANDITIKNCELECERYLNVSTDSAQYVLSDFKLENLRITADDISFNKEAVENWEINNFALKKAVMK